MPRSPISKVRKFSKLARHQHLIQFKNHCWVYFAPHLVQPSKTALKTPLVTGIPVKTPVFNKNRTKIPVKATLIPVADANNRRLSPLVCQKKRNRLTGTARTQTRVALACEQRVRRAPGDHGSGPNVLGRTWLTWQRASRVRRSSLLGHHLKNRARLKPKWPSRSLAR
jgi:hypothetical protein